MKALSILALLLCGALSTPAQSTKTIQARSYDDLRIIQVKIKSYNPVAGTIVTEFDGKHEVGPSTTKTLRPNLYITKQVKKVKAEKQTLNYLAKHFKDRQWIMMYTTDDLVVKLHQTTDQNTHTLAWWQSLRVKPFEVISFDGQSLVCVNSSEPMVVDQSTVFTFNPNNTSARSTSPESFKGQFAGSWIMTYQPATRIVIVAHKVSDSPDPDPAGNVAGIKSPKP